MEIFFTQTFSFLSFFLLLNSFMTFFEGADVYFFLLRASISAHSPYIKGGYLPSCGKHFSTKKGNISVFFTIFATVYQSCSIMKKRRISLKDLASELGVSIATVSRALHNSHEVSRELREKVQALAKEYHYRPNPFAQSLRKEAPRIIGVVVPNRTDRYYAAVLDGMEDYAREQGYSVFNVNSHEQYDIEQQAIEHFISLRVEGILVSIAQDTTDYSHFEKVHDMGIPLVFYARACMPDLFSQVVANGGEAAFQATKHLLDQGCKRVAFVGGPQHLDMVKRRKHGYLEALREHRIPIDRNLVACGPIDFQVAREATLALLDLPEPPDAVLAFNDIITYAAFDAIKERGLRIPDDVAIIGFTDGDTAAFVTPRLSAIKDQAYVLGQKACETLLRSIKGDTYIYKEVVPMILKIRESSKRK